MQVCYQQQGCVLHPLTKLANTFFLSFTPFYEMKAVVGWGVVIWIALYCWFTTTV